MRCTISFQSLVAPLPTSPRSFFSTGRTTSTNHLGKWVRWQWCDNQYVLPAPQFNVQYSCTSSPRHTPLTLVGVDTIHIRTFAHSWSDWSNGYLELCPRRKFSADFVMIMRIDISWHWPSAWIVFGSFMVATDPLADKRTWYFPSFAWSAAINGTDALLDYLFEQIE